MSDKEEFQKELKALLEKYNATISFTVDSGSDTHGLYDEKMVIYHTISNTFKAEDWIEVDGWGIDKTDL